MDPAIHTNLATSSLQYSSHICCDSEEMAMREITDRIYSSFQSLLREAESVVD